eukprot:m.75756 g.75756  ORF g.75756 m.75756 type:complete len:71 (-) comp16183_c0_seq2:2567-2779(-)
MDSYASPLYRNYIAKEGNDGWIALQVHQTQRSVCARVNCLPLRTEQPTLLLNAKPAYLQCAVTFGSVGPT